MRSVKLLGIGLAGVALMAMGGCQSASKTPRPAQVQETGHAPRSYLPLEVRNSCFVESVHFCDFYSVRRVGGANGWAKVLEWGSLQNDYTIRGGHAVAVYVLKNRLWVYDINNGFLSLDPPVERKLDLTEVTPQIFKRYPDMKPAQVRYIDALPQTQEKTRPDYTKGATTQELHDALKVAVELGRFRPVRVIEFIAPVNSYLRPCAATVFNYGTKLCLYSPLEGTRTVEAPLGSLDNMGMIKSLVLSTFPNAQDVKWFAPAQTTVIR